MWKIRQLYSFKISSLSNKKNVPCHSKRCIKTTLQVQQITFHLLLFNFTSSEYHTGLELEKNNKSIDCIVHLH